MATSYFRGFLLVLLLANFSLGQEDAPATPKDRFRIKPDLKTFPQGTPQETLESIAKAIQRNNIHYIAAHLADPKFVDVRLDDLKKNIKAANDEDRSLAAFDKIVREFSEHFGTDPQIARDLRIFAKEGEFDTSKDDVAVGTAKSINARKVYLRKLDGRWFLENRQ